VASVQVETEEYVRRSDFGHCRSLELFPKAHPSSTVFCMTRFKTYRNIYNILVEKPEGKCQFWSPRLRWEDNIKTDFKET